MKKCIAGVILFILFESCSLIRGPYPGQTVEGRQKLPTVTGVFYNTPVPIVIGSGENAWYFLDDLQGNLFRFKDTTILGEMRAFFNPGYVTAGPVLGRNLQASDSKVFALMGPPIAALTLFTQGDLDKLTPAERVTAKSLTRYNTAYMTNKFVGSKVEWEKFKANLKLTR